MRAVNHQPPSQAVNTVGKKTKMAPMLRRDNELLFSKSGLELLDTMTIVLVFEKTKPPVFAN